ncbi:MAG: hypothetical protein NTU79_01145 [Planctomycetota bacterium]|nr:hypothetical protein [Planctomycetota bacterium]
MMKTFSDNAGRTWTLAINVDAVRRVRSIVNVDLLEAVEGKLIEKLVGDPILLCDVIYVICKPEADQRSVSDEDFGRSMAGDAIDHATTSLLEELVDFFPKSRRALLTKALGKFRQLETKAIQLVDKQLDDPNLEEKVLGQLQQKLSEPMSSGV